MKADPDATRLLSLLVAICSPEIAGYRPKIEALVAHAQGECQAARRGSSRASSVRGGRAMSIGALMFFVAVISLFIFSALLNREGDGGDGS